MRAKLRILRQKYRSRKIVARHELTGVSPLQASVKTVADAELQGRGMTSSPFRPSERKLRRRSTHRGWRSGGLDGRGIGELRSPAGLKEWATAKKPAGPCVARLSCQRMEALPVVARETAATVTGEREGAQHACGENSMSPGIAFPGSESETPKATRRVY